MNAIVHEIFWWIAQEEWWIDEYGTSDMNGTDKNEEMKPNQERNKALTS